MGEAIKDIEPYGKFLSLHIGRERAVTVWDEEQDVCWLVAYSATHATHEKRDAYQHFMALGDRGEILPTADDYELLDEVATENLIDGISAAGLSLYEEARSTPGSEVQFSYQEGTALVLVDLIVIDGHTCEEGWISITFPVSTPITPDVAIDIIALLLPKEIDMNTLEMAGEFNGRTAAPSELIFTWSLLPE